MNWKKLGKLLIIIGILLAVLGAFLHFAPKLHTSGNTAGLPSSAAMRFDIVRDDAAQEKGLGGREVIPPDYGMLFVFAKAGDYGFWMKDMLASIDIIWLADDGTILGIEDSVAPDTYPTEFHPPQPVSLVLETRAGEARERGWEVGTRVPLPDIEK